MGHLVVGPLIELGHPVTIFGCFPIRSHLVIPSYHYSLASYPGASSLYRLSRQLEYSCLRLPRKELDADAVLEVQSLPIAGYSA